MGFERTCVIAITCVVIVKIIKYQTLIWIVNSELLSLRETTRVHTECLKIPPCGYRGFRIDPLLTLTGPKSRQ